MTENRRQEGKTRYEDAEGVFFRASMTNTPPALLRFREKDDVDALMHLVSNEIHRRLNYIRLEARHLTVGEALKNIRSLERLLFPGPTMDKVKALFERNKKTHQEIDWAMFEGSLRADTELLMR
ncbi:MAG: hypothetical protein AAB802_04390, partial [Patescibacteria group bacterium]